MEPQAPECYYGGMKTLLRMRLMGIAIGFAALPFIGTRAVAVVASAPASNNLWTDIKDDTYETRAHFSAGVGRLSAKLDDQIRELKAKRAAMTTDTKDWDFAMKEVDDSRSMLTSTMDALAKATTPETWADAKEKIGVAWQRSQLAVDKMNSTRTS
jgi:hypothetical protein